MIGRIVSALMLLVTLLCLIQLFLVPSFEPLAQQRTNEQRTNVDEYLGLLNRTLINLRSDLHYIKPQIEVSAGPDDRHPSIEANKLDLGSERDMISRPTILVQKRKAILFTMDSIHDYVHHSNHGGPAGEILVRKCLEYALRHLGVEVEIMHSDRDFENALIPSYDFIILDPWTWAGKGWVPKNNIKGHEERIYLLDFFGSPRLPKGHLDVPSNRFLTAFGSPWNTFLGFFLNESSQETGAHAAKKNQGVIWGKDTKHYQNKAKFLKQVSSSVPYLVSTASSQPFNSGNIHWLGHQNSESWKMLLSESKFLLGLGDPLLGPSAIEAIAHGCMYINPVYNTPVRDIHASQHSYSEKNIGHPYVCSYQIDDAKSAIECIKLALTSDLKPFLPEDFTFKNYLARVANIFNLHSTHDIE